MVQGFIPRIQRPATEPTSSVILFFPLHQVEPATELFHPDLFLADQSSYFAFADHSISLPTFAIRLTPEATSGNVVLAILSDRREYRVSCVGASFSDFVERYLASRGARLGLIPSGVCKPLGSSPRADLSHPLWDRALDG